MLRTQSMRQKEFEHEPHNTEECNVPCSYKEFDPEDFVEAENYLHKEEETFMKAQVDIPWKEEGQCIFNALCDIRDRMRDAASMNILVAQTRQKKNYDLKHKAGPKLKVGDLVRREVMANKNRKGDKLQYKWVGPFEVTHIHKNGNVILKGARDRKQRAQQVNLNWLILAEFPPGLHELAQIQQARQLEEEEIQE